MLIYYGVYNDLELLDIAVLSILFIAGVIIELFIKKTKARLAVPLVFVCILLLLEIGIVLPSPQISSGDGYAITLDISLILASYFAPVVAGVIVCFVIKSLADFIKGKRRKT